MPKDVHALIDPRDALSAPDGLNHAVARDRRSIRKTQDPIRSQMPTSPQRPRQASAPKGPFCCIEDSQDSPARKFINAWRPARRIRFDKRLIEVGSFYRSRDQQLSDLPFVRRRSLRKVRLTTAVL